MPAIFIFLLMSVSAHASSPIDAKVDGEEIAVTTFAPEVPPPITRTHAAKVIVNLETSEVRRRLADGVEYTFWTFGGRVPGKFIRVRVGDLVEMHLSNHPSSKMPHNIDLHAVTGPGGGAASSLTAPGHTSVFSFKAINPGLFVYHCATAPVGLHVSNGMYGIIYVQPEDALPKVDHEYYVMQSEFYTKGSYGEKGLQPFSFDKALNERPDYVVFNGSVGALMGDGMLKLKVGDTTRLFVGNGGPNLVSSFHVIGAIFDKVYPEGGTAFTTNVQTTLVPAGGSSIVELTTRVPGNYTMVDHSYFRSGSKGSTGVIHADGEDNKLLYSGKIRDEVYQPQGKKSADVPAAPMKKMTHAEKIAYGKTVFLRVCADCHGEDGMGIVGTLPPLYKSDYLNQDKQRAIRVVLDGLNGKVDVNGMGYDNMMPPQQKLNDDEISGVLSFLYSTWGNSGKDVTTGEVASARFKK